jgi:hypothetical protein
MMTLYHYTCEHGRAALGQAGLLLPTRVHSPHAVTNLAALRADADPDGIARVPGAERLLDLIWLTDLHPPERRAVGLTADSYAAGCDRLAYCYRVTDPSMARPYREVWRDWVTRQVHLNLTRDPAGQPGRWWVSVEPVPVQLAAATIG